MWKLYFECMSSLDCCLTYTKIQLNYKLFGTAFRGKNTFKWSLNSYNLLLGGDVYLCLWTSIANIKTYKHSLALSRFFLSSHTHVHTNTLQLFMFFV